MAIEMYYVRHGETDVNVQMQQGIHKAEDDAPLNARGVEQAEQTAALFKEVEFDVIISSPMQRALKTAEIIRGTQTIPLIVEPDLREREGGNIDLVAWHTLFDMDANIKLAGGESVKEFFERVYRVIEQTRLQYDGKRILVVAHGGVHHAVYAYVNRLPWKGNVRIELLQNGEHRVYTLDSSNNG